MQIVLYSSAKNIAFFLNLCILYSIYKTTIQRNFSYVADRIIPIFKYAVSFVRLYKDYPITQEPKVYTAVQGLVFAKNIYCTIAVTKHLKIITS